MVDNTSRAVSLWLRSHLSILTIVKAGITIVSYNFGNVTAMLFALTMKVTPR